MPVPINYPRMSERDFVDPRSAPLLPTHARPGSTPRLSPLRRYIPLNSPQLPPPLPRYEPPAPEKYDAGSRTQRDTLPWVTDEIRNHGVTMVGEFLGTLMFLFFALTTVQIANSKPDRLAQVGNEIGPSLLQILYISFGFGTSLAVNVWSFFRISGGMFNPAVTLGLCLAGGLPWIKAFLLIPVQLIAGIAASFLVSAVFPGDLNVQTNLGSGTSIEQGFFIEMLLTAELIFTILMLAVEKHRATFVAPLGIGMALFLGHIIGVNFTGASLNPARTFGPAVVLGKFTSDHWIYWVGPISGSLVAASFYRLLKYLEYESANPSQDHDGLDIYRLVVKRRTTIRRNSNDSVTSLSPLIGVD